MKLLNNDTAISNAERAKKANESGADIAIRSYANGSENFETSGVLTLIGSPDSLYISHLYEQSIKQAEDLLTCYCNVIDFVNLRNQENDTMTGLNWSEIPIMILEMGFLTNKFNDTNMNDFDFVKEW